MMGLRAIKKYSKTLRKQTFVCVCDTDGWNKLWDSIKSSLIYLVLKSIWTFIKDHIVKCICATWKSHANQSPSTSHLSYPTKKKKENNRTIFKRKSFN